MSHFYIRGGRPVHGVVRASGNKNAALPCLAAVLLTDQLVTLRNLPEIEDVFTVIELLRQLGVKVEKVGSHAYSFEAKEVSLDNLDKSLVQKVRGSVLFLGALLSRLGSVTFPLPGGDIIGQRPIDTHLRAFQDLGVQVNLTHDAVLLQESKTGRLHKNTSILLQESSVTGTENLLLYASRLEIPVTLYQAACEPHVQDLCAMLQQMGAAIDGVSSNLLTVHGTSSLGGCDFTISSDFMEIGSYIGLAAVTRGSLLIDNVPPHVMDPCRTNFEQLGITWTEENGQLAVDGTSGSTVSPIFRQATAKITDGPWPAFPSDIMSIMIVIATQATGTTLIHEKLFESRLFFVDKLIAMGANIILCDPHRAIITGPTPLHPQNVSSPDVRAGMAMLLAATAASSEDGRESRISNIYQIKRGYEHIIEKLRPLGVDIEERE